MNKNQVIQELRLSNQVCLINYFAVKIFTSKLHSQIQHRRLNYTPDYASYICFYYYHFCVFLQKPQVIGVRKEMKIGDLIQQNTTLKKFGIFMEVPTARVKVVGAIERNNDDGSYSSIVIS